MEGDTVLYQHLHKLSAIKSQEEDLENLLTSLWKTRKTGLPPQLKSSFQSLLNLPSPGELDPVKYPSYHTLSLSISNYISLYVCMYVLQSYIVISVAGISAFKYTFYLVVFFANVVYISGGEWGGSRLGHMGFQRLSLM